MAAHTITEMGSALLPLVPVAEPRLTGAADATYPARDVQVLAARVVSAAAGDPTTALPTVRAVLVAGGPSASRAADLAPMHPAALEGLKPVLRERLGDRWCTVAAARALWRLGTPPAELVAPLVDAITENGERGALPLLVETGAVQAVADLEQLAGRGERIRTSGADDNLVWQDERLRDQLRTGVAALRTA